MSDNSSYTDLAQRIEESFAEIEARRFPISEKRTKNTMHCISKF